ncbi:hypothetical protein MTR67_000886 [Solanum verrucosum]|uniref:SWIM-type domain-containing protein n=1 Tax=Solanum verrucosum TaxID=315347 RepID=A0AAF0PMG8_SOLVR|nr:hypothetical protein MTR67_000886 [Solanum verrucosum]
MRYVTVGGFYFKDPTTNNFVLVDNDFSLLNLIKDLGDGNFLDLYVQHVVDEVEVIKDGVPTVGVDEGLQQGAVQSENINVEVGVDDASDLEEEIILGVAGVDKGFEGIGMNKAARDELDPEAVEGVDLPARRKIRKVRFDPDCVVAIFELGMVFENAIEFRKAVAEYAVEYKVKLKLRPNEKHRVRVKCQHKKYKWLLYASLDKDSGDFIVKNYYPVHQCPTTTKNKLCTSNFIANKFRDIIVSQSYIKLWEIQELTNPGSSCWVRTDKESTPGKNMFVYFYVCFDALKRGWLEGCRKIIDFDGCFLKGACKGELLVAIGRNGNQQMFPIAWATVDQETKHSWSFFINFLIQDPNLGTRHGLTVMSNLQKILAARHKSIITMLEEIRHKIIDRNVEMRKFVDTWISDISPMASLVLEENKDYARDCQVRFNCQFEYEILDGHYRHIINIRKKTCTCRTWQLRGIPCQHDVLAYQYAGQDPEDHVVHWYRKDAFMKAYNYFIQSIPNMKMWPHTSDIVIESPEPKQMSGRPPKCRRKSKDDPRKKYEKLSRSGVKMTCSKCHQQGHNNKACKYVVILKSTFDYFN